MPDRDHELAIRDIHNDEPVGVEIQIVAIEPQPEHLDLHEPNFEAQVLAMLAEDHGGGEVIVVEPQHPDVDAVEPCLPAAHPAV